MTLVCQDYDTRGGPNTWAHRHGWRLQSADRTVSVAQHGIHWGLAPLNKALFVAHYSQSFNVNKSFDDVLPAK